MIGGVPTLRGIDDRPLPLRAWLRERAGVLLRKLRLRCDPVITSPYVAQMLRARSSGSAESLLKTTVYVVAGERSDLVRVWDVVAARLGRVPSTLLGVSFLGYPDQLVEIEAIAVAES